MVPGVFTIDSPCRAASPERGCTSATYPSGSASAIPVGTRARSPGRERDVDGGHQVGAGVAGMGVRRERQVGVEPQDGDGQAEPGSVGIGHGRTLSPGRSRAAWPAVPRAECPRPAGTTSGSACRCAGGCRARCWSRPSGWRSWSRCPAVGRLVGTGGPALALLVALLLVAYGVARVERRGRLAPGRPGPDLRRSTSAAPSRWTPRRPAGWPAPDADARAYLLLRPYLKRAVRVHDARPAPTPRRTGWSARGTPSSWPPRSRRGSGRRPLGMSRRGHWRSRRWRRWHRLKVWTVFSLVSALARGRGGQEGTRHRLEGRDRQEPAREPRRPRRRRGEAVAWAASAAPSSAWPGCSPSAGPPTTTAVHRPPAARAAEGRPGRRRDAAPTRRRPRRHERRRPERPLGVRGLSCVCASGRRRVGGCVSAAVRRSRGRSASSRRRAGCGGAPGSSSCR